MSTTEHLHAIGDTTRQSSAVRYLESLVERGKIPATQRVKPTPQRLPGYSRVPAKPRKNNKLVVPMTDDLRIRCEAAAERDHRTLAELGRVALEDYLQGSTEIKDSHRYAKPSSPYYRYPPARILDAVLSGLRSHIAAKKYGIPAPLIRVYRAPKQRERLARLIQDAESQSQI